MEDGAVRPLAPNDHSLSSIKVSMMRCQRGGSKEIKDSMCDLWNTEGRTSFHLLSRRQNVATVTDVALLRAQR